MRDNNLFYTQYNQAMAFLGKLIEYADDIDAILRDVAEHYDADRAYIFAFSEDGTTLDNTYEWCREGVEPQIEILQNVPYESVALWVEEFERVGAFFISSLNQDVEANSLTYEILEPQGIESLITAPLYREGRIVGFVGVDNPHVNTDDVVILQTTANILYSEISKKIAKKNQEILEMSQARMKQHIELSETRDIIASANMGIWRIELFNEQKPRMYVDDTMKRLLGIDGCDRTPEEIYDDWFSHITEEAVPSVLKSVSLMQQGFFDENTYLWTHPTKGNRYVRCGGTAKTTANGYILQGYHYDVDEVVRKNQDQMVQLQNALKEKTEYNATLSALGDIYYSMHVIDLTKDTVQEFSARNDVKRIVNRKDGATSMMVQVMRTVTKDEYLQRALEFTNLTTLPDRMQNKMVMSYELVGKNIGWFLASFIMMEKDEIGRPTKVIFTSRVIDEEKKQEEQLIHKTQTDEMTGLLNRRAYEESIYENDDIPKEEHFIYVSLDANGLKVINDTMGHSAGDEMLVGASRCMQRCFGPYGRIFRIGGDEFVVILFCDDEQAKKVLSDFDEMIEHWSGKLVDHLSISYGCANKKDFVGASVRELGAIAEKRMYEAKSAYYRRSGMDRRGQRDAHKALCELYTKILKINITDDSYQIVNMDETEQTIEMGFANRISEWLHSFGISGQVHEEDLDKYLGQTDLQYLRTYFADHKTSLQLFYRRKIKNEFKLTLLEMIPANDYTSDHQTLFLYVKQISQS